MLKIALTGPTGAGKGYVAGYLGALGVKTLDTDAVVHGLYDDPLFASTLQELFDTDILRSDRKVDRRKLGTLVYGDHGAMERLLRVVYPRVRESIRMFFDEERSAGKKAAAVDAPQLFEAGFEGDFDRILCVTAPKRERLSRIMRRDGITRSSAEQRMAHQMDARAYEKRADAVIRNGRGRDASAQLTQILLRWNAL